MHDLEDPISVPLQPDFIEDGSGSGKRGKSSMWKGIRKWACLSLVVTAMVLMGVGIILAGVLPNKNTDPPAVTAAVRTKYIAAEEVRWTYTPGGQDLVWGPLYPTYVSTQADPSSVNCTVIKAHFVEYTDDTFTVQVPGRESGGQWEHLGLLGPLIHAEAGDTVEINLRNLLAVPINLEPMGNSWNIEGLLGPIASGNQAMYRIHVPEEAGAPPSSQQSSRMYLYRSSLDPTTHENSGLVGPIIITRKGDANPDGTPKGVDKEFISVFQIFNEIETEYISFNARNFTDYGWDTDRYAINGHSWGTLKGINMNVGDNVRWYIGGLGTENGMHNFHWHGNVLQMDGHMLDQQTAIPATTMVADLLVDNPGTWLFHCHVNSHLSNGMVTTYNVAGPVPSANNGGVERLYYIAADEVEWDYLPLGGMACSTDGSVEPIVNGSLASTFLGPPQSPRIGNNYTKAIFREYTDGNFTTLKERPARDAYLGFLGPVLRAQVGDTIKIVYKNQLKQDFATTLHPHGVLYNKSSEGAPYEDGTSGADRADDAVRPGEMHTYIWAVPDRSGPGPNDPSSIMWMYHSHHEEAADTWAGLVGPMIITRRDAPVNADGSPADVDDERVLFFTAMDESQSLYSDYNIAKYLGPDANATALNEDQDFLDASVHTNLNGYMYCNMPRMQFVADSKIRFHYMSLGDIYDLHTPTMGVGGGFLNLGQREDSIEVSAGAMHSVDVVLSEPGTWQLGCNVLVHQAGGMEAMYEVIPSNTTAQANGIERTFYIQAEDVQWDYAPNKYVKCTEMNYSARAAIGGYLARTSVAIGSGMYHKTLYREYTDASFTTLKPQPDYMGFLGPLMVMEPGDTLVVVLKNTLSFAINLTPGGGLVAVGNMTAGQAVQPGETFRYEWIVPDSAGPSPTDLTSVGYGYGSTGYGSTVDHWTQATLGLEGIMVVVQKGELGPDMLPNGVDYLIPLVWQVFNENISPYLTDNMRAAGIDPDNFNLTDDAFVETNTKHTINGLMYCNLPSPKFTFNSTVRFVFMAVGSIEGLHAPVLTKFPLVDAIGPHPSARLMPGFTTTMDMYATELGTYPMWCNVHDHVEAGMIGSFEVVPNL